MKKKLLQITSKTVLQEKLYELQIQTNGQTNMALQNRCDKNMNK